MRLRNRKAFTLVEGLISVLLLAAFVSGFMGTFLVSRLSTERAQHRVTALNILKHFMEREVYAGYDGGGSDADEVPPDFYVTVTTPNPSSMIPSVPITVDNVTYTVTPDPYYPDNVIDDSMGRFLQQDGVNFKITGFRVTWTEDILGSGIGPTCSERVIVYLFS